MNCVDVSRVSVIAYGKTAGTDPNAALKVTSLQGSTGTSTTRTSVKRTSVGGAETNDSIAYS